MYFLGDKPAGSTLYVPFATYNSSGASVTITGLATTDIEIYKNGSVTQRASDNGYALLDTDGIDFDSTTGLHGFSVDLSDNSDSGFYAAGSEYWLVVNAVTCDSQTIILLFTFRIVAAETIAGTPKVDVGAVSGDATAADTLELFVEAVDQSTGQLDSGSFAAGAITAAAIADGAIDAATFAADVDAEILSYIVDDATRIDASALNTASSAIGNNGSGLTEAGGTGDQFSAIPWNAAWDTEVQSEVEDGLAAYDPPTRTEATADKDAILDKVLAYFQLTARDDAAIATDRATELGEINNDEGSGGGAFDNTTGSLEAAYTFHNDADTYLSGLDTRVPAALTGAGNMKCDAVAISGDATAADTLELFVEALDQATGQLDSGSFQTGAIASGAFASGAITAASIAANAFTSAKFASDYTDRLETDILAILEGNPVTDFTAIPAGTPTYSEALGMLAAAILNKVVSDRTSGIAQIHDGDNNVIGEATITDDGDTFTRTKYAAP